MDALPTELLHQILSYIPPSSLATVRLVSRALSYHAFHLCFAHLKKWLDYNFSHQRITALAHDAYSRPVVMWSPWASEPDGEVDEVFLGVVWRLLMRGDVSVRIPLGKKNGGDLTYSYARTQGNHGGKEGPVVDIDTGLDARELGGGDGHEVHLNTDRERQLGIVKGHDSDREFESHHEYQNKNEEQQPILLTPENFASLSGKPDLSARKLRIGQNRFLLYRDCLLQAAKEQEEQEQRKRSQSQIHQLQLQFGLDDKQCGEVGEVELVALEEIF